MNHYFPNLYKRIDEIEDYRGKKKYELVEIIVGCLLMFLLKEESRNAMNNDRNEDQFRKNVERIFKIRLAHPDTIDNVMRKLDEKALENLKTDLVKSLIKKRVFDSRRLFGKYYQVAVDATRVMNTNKGHCGGCLHTTSKNGKQCNFHVVLEAKLVTPNGFCISIATEWVQNPEEYVKQDSEGKAFKRLAQQLKENFPRLLLCIQADGLYPNEPFFEICQENGWHLIVTLKDGNLKSVWKQVADKDKLHYHRTERIYQEEKDQIVQKYDWVSDVDYRNYKLYWFECTETIANEVNYFAYLSSLKVVWKNVLELTQSGRMRWKIENEGFNIQKNHGYGLTHKYSRVSMLASKNYYQCLQIAHLINQLFELGSLLKPFLTAKMTLKHLWKTMLREMASLLNFSELDRLLAQRIQIRFD